MMMRSRLIEGHENASFATQSRIASVSLQTAVRGYMILSLIVNAETMFRGRVFSFAQHEHRDDL
jgi:hypothetical protein